MDPGPAVEVLIIEPFSPVPGRDLCWASGNVVNSANTSSLEATLVRLKASCNCADMAIDRTWTKFAGFDMFPEAMTLSCNGCSTEQSNTRTQLCWAGELRHVKKSTAHATVCQTGTQAQAQGAKHMAPLVLLHTG